MKRVYVWKFIRADLKISHEENLRRWKPGRRIQASFRRSFSVRAPVQKPHLCSRGFHGSRRISEAERYVSSGLSRLGIFELSGKIVVGDDKLCASHAKLLVSSNVARLNINGMSLNPKQETDLRSRLYRKLKQHGHFDVVNVLKAQERVGRDR